jgi:phage shock protein A
MRKLSWLVVLLGALALEPRCASGKEKAEAKKPDTSARGFTVLKVETLAEKLGQEVALTDDQKTKLEAQREELKKKYVEVMAKEQVKAAEEEVKKAQEAVKAAQAKVKEALGGFDQQEEWKKILGGILTEAQMAKLYPSKGGAHDKKDTKKVEPKAKVEEPAP